VTTATAALSPYDALRARHAFQYDSYLGGERYRAPSRTTLTSVRAWRYATNPDGSEVRHAVDYTTYLVPHPAENAEAFDARLARACYLNVVAPIVDAYAEGVTARVDRDIPAGYGPMDDVDARGSSWGEHVEEVARWAVLYGYVVVVYDTPAANPAPTRAAEAAAGTAPRAIIVHPTGIAWVEVDDAGRVVEFAWVEHALQDPGTIEFYAVRVRVLTLRGGTDGATPEWLVLQGTVATTPGSTLAGQRAGLQVATGPDGAPLRGPLAPALGGALPLVFAYYRRISASRHPLGQSLVDDACDIARSVYNKLSEEDEIHTKAGFPFLAVPLASTGGQLDPQAKQAIGPGRGMGYDSSTGAPTYVQPSPDSTQELRASIMFRVAAAFRLCGIEVATDQSGQAESGVALRVRARGFEVRATRFANAMARYERAGLALWAKLAGSGEQARVEYPKRFTLPDPTEDLANVLSLLTQLPVEVGVGAKLALVRKALDAVLNLPDEDLDAIVDEVKQLLESDAAEFDGKRALNAAERSQRMKTLAGDGEGEPNDDAADPDDPPDAAGKPAPRPAPPQRRGATAAG